jgi:hypothetical protein
MSQFNIDEIEKRTLSGLKDFQRATVERVDYLFRHNQNRVLVADEVGMGKTLIARGAIVKTARLRIEEKDDLFKVIYICSNQNIANQNIRKLDVTGKNAIGSVSDTRLSMQHLSATPYKLYSTLEEIDENQLDEHYAEFFQVMNFLFDDEVKDIANSYDCVLLPAGLRSRKVQWEVPRKSNGWAYGFGRANVWYASEEDSRLQDYLTRLVKQIDEYDGENWIDKYAK